MSKKFADDMAKTIHNIFGWTANESQPVPPKFDLPDYVWDRVEFFSAGFEDGLTYTGCLKFVLAYDEKECEKLFRIGDPRPWLPVSEDFKKWRDQYAMREMELAAVLIYT